jgi:hypothetical protein
MNHVDDDKQQKVDFSIRLFNYFDNVVFCASEGRIFLVNKGNNKITELRTIL